MSWTGNYWGRFGVIQKAERDFYEGVRSAADMVALASVHYSAAGTAFVRLKRGNVFYLWRLWQARTRALALVNQAYDIGGRGFTADQVDVACCIWWRFDRRTKRAVPALRRLCMYPGEKAHTLAFILMHKVRWGEERLTTLVVDLLQELGRAAWASGEAAQAARVYRQLHDLLPSGHSLRTVLRERAAACALEVGATDQLEKMGQSVH